MKDPNRSNITEVLGRNHLIEQLINDGVHAAVPLWDQGVDLIAYFQAGEGLVARPLQLKVAESSRWSVHQKYADIRGLLMVYIWKVREAEAVEIYAMSYPQAYEHLLASGDYTKSDSWLKQGGYSIGPVRNRLWESLQHFRMKQGMWRARLQEV